MYSRVIDDSVLTLSASGWVYDDTFVLFDFETKSLWYHFPSYDGLICIAGPYADRLLPELTSTRIRWNELVAGTPASKYMVCIRRHGPFGCAGY